MMGGRRFSGESPAVPAELRVAEPAAAGAAAAVVPVVPVVLVVPAAPVAPSAAGDPGINYGSPVA